MIKNIVFDYGNVLIHWNPEHILADMGYSEEDIALLRPVIFDDERWYPNDAGLYSADEYAAICCELLPERLHGDVYRITHEWFRHLPPIEGMENIVRVLKDSGYSIYLLSNIAKEFASHPECVPANDCFDGMVFSGVEGIIKPDRRIFELLLQRYGLKAEESVFVDDRRRNTDAAEECGFSVYRFDKDVSKFSDFISRINN